MKKRTLARRRHEGLPVRQGWKVLVRRLLFATAFLFVTVYVYGQDVHYNYDPGANFSNYKTY